ncbi:MAG: ATP-binding protein [Pseudodesulfovibrio sp.]|nr:ATP-binding protein [Pseudodesulfovibrio sp.]
MPTIRAKANLESLPVIRDYVLNVAHQAKITGEVPPKLDLVLEEVLVNVASHAYGPDGGDVEVTCTVIDTPDSDSRIFRFEMRDWGSHFNPLKTDMPDTTADIDDRQIGGLGLLLVTTLADKCEYTRQGDMNVLTLFFNV